VPEGSYGADLARLLPEVALALVSFVVLVADLIARGRDSRRIGWLTLAGLLVVAATLLREWGEPSTIVFGMVTVDAFAVFWKLFVTAALGAVVLFTIYARETPRHGAGEFYFVLLSAGLGAFFLVSTTNLLLLVLALELLGLSSYVLAGISKGDRRSAEAALKYVIFGAAATGVMLFGLSILYGLSGTLDLREMARVLAGAEADVGTGRAIDRFALAEPALAVGIVLSLVGFGYKISAVPFHWWTPDVYEGAPTAVSTFLAVASKGAAFGALLRFTGALFVGPVEGAGAAFAAKLSSLLALLAAVTMTYGNFAALRQRNLKRLLAYSSIAHAGYALMGVATLRPSGFEASIFYLAAYYFMNLGAFGAVIYFARTTGNEEIEGLRGLGWKTPLVSGCLVVFLISLTGIPPTVGFFGKWYLFVACWNEGLGWLTVVAAANSVISLFYYFRIAKALLLVPGEEAVFPHRRVPALAGVLGLLGAGTVWFGISVGGLQAACAKALTLF